MNEYFVVLSQTKQPEYPCVTGYNVIAPTKHDAHVAAKARYVQDFGFEGYVVVNYSFINRRDLKL